MTSDGITTEDWDRVHELALSMANSSDEDEHLFREQMLALLRELTNKYGERPSIVATQADYVEAPGESEKLLLHAFDLAVTQGDNPNVREIALSLANFYATQAKDGTSATRWLEVAKPLIEGGNEAADLAECRQIEESIARLE